MQEKNMKKLLMNMKSLTMILTLMMLLSIVGPAMAQENRGEMPNDLLPGQGPTDPAELETFLDEFMAKGMEEHHIPGAAVSVVKDGKLFFTKGYGYADLENKIPVDPEQTIFSIGSVGKLFTWTAVMQLVEQGKLDLDTDVNTYLDFHIPDTYPQPITLKHLLTHTAGFEDLWFEVFAWDTGDVIPVGEWLASHIPARVHPPGEIAAYSNYGANLAGYIVARVSGQPYEQYLQEHIFDPLGMERSSANLPLSPDLRSQASLGYWEMDGVLKPVPKVPNDYLGQPAMVPAGGHLSSVTDMARFMIAHLNGGRYSDAENKEGRILEESTTQKMHNTLYTPDPRILGTAYGCFDFSDNGQRTLGLSGGTLGFATLLLLLPDQNLGVFVVYNNEDVGELTIQHFGFQREFFDHYYPAPVVEPIQPPPDFAERAGRFAGSYKTTRSAYTTFEKIGSLMSSPVEISDIGNGMLLYNDHGVEAQLVEVEPLYFRQVDGPLSILFREDDRGRITHMFADFAPQYAYEKLYWYETPSFNTALFLGCILIFLSMLPIAMVRAIRNRHQSGDRRSADRGIRMAYRTILGTSVLNLLFVISLILMLSNLGFPRFGVSLFDRIVFGLGVLSAILTAGTLVYAVLSWKKGYWGVLFRAYCTLVSLAAVAFVWFLNYWNLMGWRF
jgi:CubicO group peptidase (beta-lactamase class C family)